MTLRVAIDVEVGNFALSVAFDAEPGRTTAVIGPNGAGKTTLLRCLAGLQPIDRGRIELGGRVFDDAEADIRVAARDRRVGVVFQQHLLFPSMSAVDNVAFGLRARGVERTAARASATELLARVGLAGRERSRPHELSGGQSQRVALARALATDPGMVLLDEPLAALDATTRGEVRRELRRHLDGLEGAVRILVTHDLADVFALADRVVVIQDGRVTQQGPLQEVVTRPRSRYLADLLGLDLVAAEVRAGAVWFAGVELAGLVPDPMPEGWPEGPVWLALHPRDVRIVAPGTGRWDAVVASVDVERDRAVVATDGPVRLRSEVPLTVLSAGFGVGDLVGVAFDAAAVALEARSPS